MDFLQSNLPDLLAGVSTGGQYARIAIGYTMVYGILRLINFAHGDVFMANFCVRGAVLARSASHSSLVLYKVERSHLSEAGISLRLGIKELDIR